MKKIITRIVVAALVFGAGVFAVQNTYAENEIQPRTAEGETEQEEKTEAKTSLTLSPASQTLQLSSKSSYDGTMSVTNDGDNTITVNVYATPYSYIYSEEEDAYKLGYSYENSFTQISRWIKIKGPDGKYETSPNFKIKPGEKIDIKYRVTTPDKIPAGGQYAVIFAQVKSGSTATGAIKADPGLGMIIYGHSTEGQTVISSEIRNLTLERGVKNNSIEENKKEVVYGTAKVKNTGNVDFFARAILKVEPIIGFASYETPMEKGMISIIPETELTMTDEWAELPGFGIYKVTWTVIAGDNTETTEKILFFCSPAAIFIIILLLTIIAVTIIMIVKMRKARHSRLAI